MLIRNWRKELDLIPMFLFVVVFGRFGGRMPWNWVLVAEIRLTSHVVHWGTLQGPRPRPAGRSALASGITMGCVVLFHAWLAVVFVGVARVVSRSTPIRELSRPAPSPLIVIKISISSIMHPRLLVMDRLGPSSWMCSSILLVVRIVDQTSDSAQAIVNVRSKRIERTCRILVRSLDDRVALVSQCSHGVGPVSSRPVLVYLALVAGLHFWLISSWPWYSESLLFNVIDREVLRSTQHRVVHKT